MGLIKNFFSRRVEEHPYRSIPYKVHPTPPYHPILLAKEGESFAVGYSPAEFKQITGVAYLAHLEFDCLASLKRAERQSRFVMSNPEVSPSLRWLGTFFSKELSEGFVNDVVIQWIDDTIGYGVFANRNFSPGEFIGEYTGVVKKSRFFYQNINEYCFHYPTHSLFINVHTIDAKYKGNETRFMNHHNAPNCEAFGCFHDNLMRVCIRTIQNVARGTELTYDYGKDWWGDRAVLSIKLP
jgi:SET domain